MNKTDKQSDEEFDDKENNAEEEFLLRIIPSVLDFNHTDKVSDGDNDKVLVIKVLLKK